MSLERLWLKYRDILTGSHGLNIGFLQVFSEEAPSDRPKANPSRLRPPGHPQTMLSTSAQCHREQGPLREDSSALANLIGLQQWNHAYVEYAVCGLW